MNKWIGSGKISEEPVIKYNSNKAYFVLFTLMTKRRIVPDGGQLVDFIDCKCTGRLASFAAENLCKGKKIEVIGELQSGHYTNKSGEKVYTKTVFVEELNFTETKAEEESRLEEERRANEAPAGPVPENYAETFPDVPDMLDDDLPFR